MVLPKTLTIPVQLAIIQLLAINSMPPLIDVSVAASVFSVMVPVLPGHPGSKLLSIILLTQTYLPSLVPPSHSLLILVVLAITPLLIYLSSTNDLPPTLSPFNFLTATMLNLHMRPNYLYLCSYLLLVMYTLSLVYTIALY
jgi:hypothetical protein